VTPRKRSRGGRGRGGRAEGAAASEAIEAVSTSIGDVDPPDVTPELAEQPPSELEDQPVVPDLTTDPDPVQPVVTSPVVTEPPVPDAVAADGAADGAAAGPKRRRRATSRPAGPPTVSV
jgi:hypothetical protein